MVKAEMLDCEEVWREISNFVDDDVDADLRGKMEEHFRTCAKCVSLLAGTRNVMTLYGDERLLEVPAGLGQRLEARIEQKLETTLETKPAWRTATREPHWSTWSAWLMPVGAVALFVFSLALVDQLTFKSPPRSVMAEGGHNIPPDMQVVISDGSKVFHVVGCRFIHDKATERTVTAGRAMQDGYVPCTRCLREYLPAASLTERAVVEAEIGEDGQGDAEVRAGH